MKPYTAFVVKLLIYPISISCFYFLGLKFGPYPFTLINGWAKLGWSKSIVSSVLYIYIYIYICTKYSDLDVGLPLFFRVAKYFVKDLLWPMSFCVGDSDDNVRFNRVIISNLSIRYRFEILNILDIF